MQCESVMAQYKN